MWFIKSDVTPTSEWKTTPVGQPRYIHDITCLTTCPLSNQTFFPVGCDWPSCVIGFQIRQDSQSLVNQPRSKREWKNTTMLNQSFEDDIRDLLWRLLWVNNWNNGTCIWYYKSRNNNLSNAKKLIRWKSTIAQEYFLTNNTSIYKLVWPVNTQHLNLWNVILLSVI